jgi:hypothetical protein
MVVVVSHGCWLIGWCQSVVGSCGGKPPPVCRSWILVILVACVMVAITGFRVVGVAANLSLVQVPPLLFPFLRVLAVVLPHQLYCHLLSLLLLLCLLPPVLTAEWRAMPELLRSATAGPSSMFLLSLRVRRLSRGTVRP